MLVAMIAGCAFCVAVSNELGPSAMILERLQFSVESISSSIGLHVRGKAASQSWVIPTRCTPWPGKNRAVRGRRGFEVVALWRVDLCGLLFVCTAGRAEDGNERQEVDCCDGCEARRSARRDIAPGRSVK